MEIEKKRELGIQRLLLSIGEDGSEINPMARPRNMHGDFREQMMIENEIYGHVPFVIRNINGKKTYEYNIEGLSSLEEEAERKLGFETIRCMAEGLSEVVEAGSVYLLKEEDYVVTPGTVFFDKKNKGLKLIYCPGYGQNLKTRLAELMEYCLDTIDYNDAFAVRSAYGLYMKLRDGCSLRQLKELVNEVGNETETPEEKPEGKSERKPEKEPEKKPEGKSEKKTGEEPERKPERKPEERAKEWNLSKYPDDGPVYPKEKKTPMRIVRDFWNLADNKVKVTLVACTGACIILWIYVASGKVAKLSQRLLGIPLWFPLMIVVSAICMILIIRSVRPVLKLLSKQGKAEETDDNETVLMIGNGRQDSLILISDEMPGLCTDRFPCVIGKDKTSCDLAVDAKGVSRRHLCIARDVEGGFTVEDLNTINGTFINGHKLAPNMTFSIREGDEISFGSVSYYVNHLG